MYDADTEGVPYLSGVLLHRAMGGEALHEGHSQQGQGGWKQKLMHMRCAKLRSTRMFEERHWPQKKSSTPCGTLVDETRFLSRCNKHNHFQPVGGNFCPAPLPGNDTSSTSSNLFTPFL